MNKVNYLNVGCGDKFHESWVNVDMVSCSPHVIATNLLNGIPYPDDHFDVVYHSQVLEHIPKEKAEDFIRDCLRVLKPGGILRIVLPDLENIVDEYKKLLNENLNNPTKLSEANYDWIMLEMYDQTVRNYTGGQMAEYINKPDKVNEQYLVDRIGFNRIDKSNGQSIPPSKNYGKIILGLLTLKPRYTHKIKHTIKRLFQSEAAKVGEFRFGGELHMWMYDRFSLSRLLKRCGAAEVSIKNPYESDIPGWKDYELDVKGGVVYDPKSLFMEAKKKKN